MSRRPDLRAAIADHATLPKLQQALQQGAITRQELDWRMDQARARVDRLFQKPGVPALQSTYAFWEARGTTATASPVSTEARYSSGCRTSARYSGIRRRSFSSVASTPGPTRLQPVESPDTSGPDIFSGNRTQSSRTGISVVPGDVFTALSDALSALATRLEIAASPTAWQLPSTPSTPPHNQAGRAGPERPGHQAVDHPLGQVRDRPVATHVAVPA